MSKVVVLFPDTNLFIQCRPLEELDWSEYSSWEEVRLYVTRAVQREIDGQKNKGGERLASKARRASSMFRKLIIDGAGYLLIRSDSPRVALYLIAKDEFSQKSASSLDLSFTDDQLVATLDSYVGKKPDNEDVFLLSDDTGPILSARSLDLPFRTIPASWLLKPETSREDKERAALEARVTALERQGPSINVSCDKAEGVRGNLEVYGALTDREVESLVRRIEQLCPMKEFRSQFERNNHLSAISSIYSSLGIHEPREYEIEKYQSAYARWLDSCEARLRTIGLELNCWARAVDVEVRIANEGALPAADPLIAGSMVGGAKCIPSIGENEEDDQDEEFVFEFPPIPPRPRSPGDAIFHLTSLDNYVPPFVPPESARDPEAIYWRDGRPTEPCDNFELECGRFRHAMGQVLIGCRIIPRTNSSKVKGLLKIEIHASNMAEPKVVKINLDLSVSEVTPFDFVMALLNRQFGGAESST